MGPFFSINLQAQAIAILQIVKLSRAPTSRIYV